MRFSTLILKNVTRRPLRSALTVFAVGIAVGAVVALVGISTEFERSFMRLYENAGIDLIVVRAGLRQQLSSTLDQGLAEQIEKIDGVKLAVPVMIDVVSAPDVSMYGMIVQGCTWASLPYFVVREGRHFTPADDHAVMLGKILAANLEKKVGDKIEIYEGEIFQIVGIFESKNVFENGSLLMPLAELQRIMDRPGQVTGFSVILDPSQKGVPSDRIRREIEKLAKGLQALTAEEHVNSLEQIRAARVMAWLTSAIALAVGTAGVLNTMVMSVHERTSEIGILRAVGWKKGRVLGMVLSESVLLSQAGACAGTLGAMLLVIVLTKLPLTNGVINGRVPLAVIGQGFTIALVVGVVGGLWAAWLAARMLPTAALRHE